jgi:membrane-associated protease RseP (regulator of RpoE activity)
VASFPAPPVRLEFITEGEAGIEVPEALIRTRIDLLLSDMPEAPEPPKILMSPASRIGLDLIQVTPELRTHLGGPENAGLLVGNVQDGSPGEKAGIVAGDLLVEVEGRPVRGRDGWVILLNTIDRSSYQVGLIRDGRARTVQLELPGRAAGRDETALAVQNALKSIESSLESEEMSRELRDHLQAVREQLQRALNPPPKRSEPVPESAREQDPTGR